MVKSLPSRKIAVVDAPEVRQFRAEFDYNFFLPDEMLNDTGRIAPEFITRRTLDAFDPNFIESLTFQSKVPRYNKLMWKPFANQVRPADISITNNFDKIHNEQNFALQDYSNLDIQDTGADQRLSFFLRRALDEVQRGFAPPNRPESPLDVAKSLNRLTPVQLRGSFLASVLVNLKELGVRFVTKNNKEVIAKTLAGQIQKTKVRLQLNNKVITKILESATENPTGLFEDEAELLLNDALQKETDAIAATNSSVFSEQDYDLEILEYIGIRNIDAPDLFDSTVQVVGYIIDKQEILETGDVVDRAPLIVENPSTGVTVDLKVKYGSTYVYRIRSVVYVEVQSQDVETDNLLAVSFLVCSRQSPAQTVVCTENIPPPPPADFGITWDHADTSARLIWSFPPNSQRDIKYFQVFRRRTINEPFELIKQFDFDNSLVRTVKSEIPQQFLVEAMAQPKSYYLDKEFGRDSTYIYAVCSIDAHGMSSGYSMQLEAKFDRYKNGIVKKLVSVAGAPKAYPNMYLNQDTFVDTIKDSGHKRLSVYFNPEYLKVFDNNGSDLRLIKTNSDASYKLSIINIDLQSQKIANITIDDKTRPTQGNDDIGEV